MVSKTRLLQLICLVLAVAALVAATPSKAGACPYTCLRESGIAYHYCQVNPPGTFYDGCWFGVTCGDNTSSANQIYYQNCVF
jgi:hypothetical protein